MPGTSRKNSWLQWGEIEGRWKMEGLSPVSVSLEKEPSVQGTGWGLGGDWAGTGWGCPRTSDPGALTVCPHFPLDLP